MHCSTRFALSLTMALCSPFRKGTTGKSQSYLGPKIWNSLPSELKSGNNITAFKHKNHFAEICRKRKMLSTSPDHGLVLGHRLGRAKSTTAPDAPSFLLERVKHRT